MSADMPDIPERPQTLADLECSHRVRLDQSCPDCEEEEVIDKLMEQVVCEMHSLPYSMCPVCTQPEGTVET